MVGAIESDQHLDFNVFEAPVDDANNALRPKLAASERKQILNAVSWRDPRAAKVVKKRHQLTAAKLKELLAEFKTTADKLADHGYWPVEAQAATSPMSSSGMARARSWLGSLNRWATWVQATWEVQCHA